MKKRVCIGAFIAVWVLLTAVLTACQGDTPASTAPEKEGVTYLEFWIAEQVDDQSFEGMQEKYGWMGAREYYGTGYLPTIGEDGQQHDPEIYVRYLVTAFPDYSDETRCVTEINFNDPRITFYGLSVDSSFEVFETIFLEKGYEITKGVGQNPNIYIAKKGIYSFTLAEEDGKRSISIRAEVSNREGIVF